MVSFFMDDALSVKRYTQELPEPRVEGLGFKGLEFRVWFRVRGLGFRV